MGSKQIVLTVDEDKYNQWEAIAKILYLNIEEYVRRCTDAHTNILRQDSFDLVHEGARRV